MKTSEHSDSATLKKVGIIGGGRGGAALLQALSQLDQVLVVGICDIDSHAPALDIARAAGIAIYTDMEQLVGAQSMDWLINATNRSIAQHYILGRDLNNTTLIDGHIAELIWQLLLDFEKALGQSVHSSEGPAHSESLQQLQWTLIQRIVNIAQPVQRELEYIAFHDPLTGLYSRQMLREFTEWEISHAYRHERTLSMVVMDIDHFKRVNDTFGHDVGDRILKELAQLLSTSCRRSDMAARYGGEEFVVVLPHTNLSSAAMWAERMRSRTQQHLHTPDDRCVTISLGVAGIEFEEDGASDIITSEALFKRADEVLYEAKNAGRNRVASVRIAARGRRPTG